MSKITQLDEISSIGDNDIICIVQDGVTKRITVANFLALTFRKDKANQLSTVAEKTTFTDNDFLFIEDSTDGTVGTKKKIKLVNVLQKAVRVDKPDQIDSIDVKADVTTGDKMMIEDAANDDNKKKITVGSLKSVFSMVQFGSDAPVDTPPSRGAIFIDTAHVKIYISIGTVDVSDWHEIELA